MSIIDHKRDLKFVQEQVEQYKKIKPRYEMLASVVKELFEKAVKIYAPQSFVSTREKAVASFAEKILRKRLNDPVNEFTDLCGGRIITNTPSEVEAVCQFIESHFDIDWDNSIDVSQRHKPAEFGYRSVHYIVQFRRGVFPTKNIGIEIPPEIIPDQTSPMKAEIQVRTLLEHSWAAFTHDKVYKSAFNVPDKWSRKLASLAAVLEEADRSFERIRTGLKAYASSYGTYMSEEEMQKEIGLLEITLEHDKGNVKLAHQIGKLAITLEDWRKAHDILYQYADTGYQPTIKNLGVAMCKLHCDKTNSMEYRQGQAYLESAIKLDPNDAGAIASLAGTWKGIDEKKVRKLYRRAFEVDPSDPYPLGNYLVCEISYQRNLSIVPLLRPIITTAIKRLREHVEVGVNLPWAFYDIGKFFLLLGKPYESLSAYAKAIKLSTSPYTIETSLDSINRLAVVKEDLAGWEWIRRLLLVGRATKFPTDSVVTDVKKLVTKDDYSVSEPVVIVAGGCNSSVEKLIQGYKDLMLEAFRDFKGTIISGGTTQGISGLVGDIQESYPDAIRTIGYVPRSVPVDATVDKDSRRYSEIRKTNAEDFTPIESLQNWIDLLASGIEPAKVKVVGINGGKIASIEYKLAAALGAHVALLEESGREAAKIFMDDDWKDSPELLHMPPDAMILGAFIVSGNPALPKDMRETIAKGTHETYRKARLVPLQSQDPSMADWDQLPDPLKESNRKQADDIYQKLNRIGCEVHEVNNKEIEFMRFTHSEIEIMAEMVHARWNVERLMDGWRYADEKDVSQKVSPYLVNWFDLPEEVKNWDREIVKKIPELLGNVGLEIRRIS